MRKNKHSNSIKKKKNIFIEKKSYQRVFSKLRSEWNKKKQMN